MCPSAVHRPEFSAPHRAFGASSGARRTLNEASWIPSRLNGQENQLMPRLSHKCVLSAFLCMTMGVAQDLRLEKFLVDAAFFGAYR